VGLAYGAAADRATGHPRRISYLIGPDGTVLKAYAKVSPADHPNEVLEDLATRHRAAV
jgi:peroxiredoxin